MGFHSRISSIAAPARLRADAGGSGDPFAGLYQGYQPYIAGGSHVPPELALTLSHVYCAVSTISDDFGTMSCQAFRRQGDEGRARVRYGDPGIGALAYKLRWQPNAFQTAKGFWSTLVWQYLLRPKACAEIIYAPGSDTFIGQLVPRHPDRVREERLPSGRVRFKLLEPDGNRRYLTQDEMFVVRNTSSDGLHALGRLDYGGPAIDSALQLQAFTRAYFKKGATAALLGTYKGPQMEDEQEAALHASISRYVSGTDNAGGILLVPEDIDVKSLGVEPEKAQLLGLKELSGRDVARLFKMPPHKLMIGGQTAAYASQVQSALDYVTGCQMPIVVEFEQSIQRDLIVAVDRFFVKFNMDYLLRGDTKSRMEAYEIAIRSRIMRPSEARVKEDMSPDPDLDRLSESDHRPGASTRGGRSGDDRDARAVDPRSSMRTYHEAFRLVRHERVAVEKLAKQHAHDVEGWQAGLRDFYSAHAASIAGALKIPVETARAYGAQHGAQFETQGIGLIATREFGDRWERAEAEELALLALDGIERMAA